MTTSPSTSERQCAGCREHAPREELLRFVWAEELRSLVPDPRRKLPGRGASVHPRFACIEQAATKGGFSRSFRRSIVADARELEQSAAGQYRSRVAGLLLAARRAKKMTFGADAVSRSISEGECAALVVATDAGRAGGDARRAAAEAECPVATGDDKATLGRLFGREAVAVVALTESGIAAEVLVALARVADLLEDA